ncbi:nuclear transport factor 2 family protein [Alteraurantiacibacter aquimixticola]|uniref:Nuclear transport factor 2 family protein n=1 Tax=Alteraurantiacibacter aquimixticola TaxID=2489173 RepID=A0A4T3F178_9SPHN|nr:nuclear transport factor 2 family protein [Alteraurantiacibacter aquimixticola]TIX50935.1 nuclear transport factor 2 family protein [Alteraurantiacibacter aquimixticola]
MRRSLSLIAALLVAALPGAPAAQDVSRVQIDELARDVSRVEAIREVKDLQRFYAQYAQFGLAAEMAALFADDAELVWGEESLRGRPAIENWLRARIGPRGLAPGALHAEFIEDPLVNLSADGGSAKSRWMGMTMSGDGEGGSSIEGGVYENEYVLEGGTWKLSRLHYFPQFEGDYANGWANIGNAQLPQVPFHFTVDETGIPVPPAEGAAPQSNATLDSLEDRIAAMNAEDVVRNLQNAYGYYVDRKMWDDVVDLFATDGVVEIAGVGTFAGPDAIRQAMERMGPQGLEQGQFNEHPSFDTIVTVADNRREAYARGIALGMMSDGGEAGWSFAVFRNRFVLDEGLWKIREMRIYPLLEADYASGWAHGGTAHLRHGVLPAFTEPHPVTGMDVTITGFELAGSAPLTPALEPAQSASPARSDAERFLDARRRLQRSLAYDGVVNVSSAYGYYLDDFFWVELSSIFAEDGNKHSPFAGFYLGRERIKAAATTMWGEPPELRDGISYHWRFQPVIHVSHDGRSANLRTRLWQPRTGLRREAGEEGNSLYSPGFNSGMYPNDQAVLEDGIWRLWSLTIDEHYMTSQNWKDGWAGVPVSPPGQAAGQSPLVERLPPDILMTELGRRAEHFRGGTGVTYAWPDILPMWFHYKNPVSGRVPENYWPDSVPALDLPESRLIAHGYQMPPNGPEVDGIHIELTPPEANVME